MQLLILSRAAVAPFHFNVAVSAAVGLCSVGLTGLPVVWLVTLLWFGFTYRVP